MAEQGLLHVEHCPHAKLQCDTCKFEGSRKLMNAHSCMCSTCERPYTSVDHATRCEQPCLVNDCQELLTLTMVPGHMQQQHPEHIPDMLCFDLVLRCPFCLRHFRLLDLGTHVTDVHHVQYAHERSKALAKALK